MFGWLRNKSLQMLSAVVRYALTDCSLATILSGGMRSKAGQDVTAETSLLLSGVFRAVTLYGECMGTMPCGVYRRGFSRRKYYSDHPTHAVLHSRANPEMTSITYNCLMQTYRLLHGNAVAEIEWNGRGQCIALWPIEPWRLTITRDRETKRLLYTVQGDQGQRTLGARDVIHIPNFSWCGVHGLATIRFARESIGRTLAAGENQSATLDAGGVPAGWFKHKSRMDKPARDNFRKEMRENNVKDKGAIGILWEDMDYVKSGFNAKDLEFLGTLENGMYDISNFFGVPPHMLGLLERAINNNAEVGDLSWVKYSILPLCNRHEQEYNEKLLTDDLYAKHSVEGLLRGDTTARAAWYKEMRGLGIYSTDDILDFEDMDPIGGEVGRLRVINAAYIPIDRLDDYWEAKSQPGASAPDVIEDPDGGDKKPEKQPGQQQPPAGKKKSDEDDQENQGGDTPRSPKPTKKLDQDPFFQSEWQRMLRRENKAIQKAAKREMQLRSEQKPGEFLAWIDEFCGKHQGLLMEVLKEPTDALYGDDPLDLSGFNALGSIVCRHMMATRLGLMLASEVPANQFEATIAEFIEKRSPQPELATA